MKKIVIVIVLFFIYFLWDFSDVSYQAISGFADILGGDEGRFSSHGIQKILVHRLMSLLAAQKMLGIILFCFIVLLFIMDLYFVSINLENEFPQNFSSE